MGSTGKGESEFQEVCVCGGGGGDLYKYLKICGFSLWRNKRFPS